MVLTSLVSIILRVAELVFATIVAGINGYYLHAVRHTSSWSQGRFIYAEVVAGIAIFFSLIWLIPFSGSFIHWPVDFLISVTWFIAFGLLVSVSQAMQFPETTRVHANEARYASTSMARAVPCSTGIILPSEVTSVAGGRLSLLSLSSPPSAGSSRASLGSSGFVTVNLEPTAAVLGIADPASKSLLYTTQDLNELPVLATLVF